MTVGASSALNSLSTKPRVLRNVTTPGLPGFHSTPSGSSPSWSRIMSSRYFASIASRLGIQTCSAAGCPPGIMKSLSCNNAPYARSSVTLYVPLPPLPRLISPASTPAMLTVSLSPPSWSCSHAVLMILRISPLRLLIAVNTARSARSWSGLVLSYFSVISLRVFLSITCFPCCSWLSDP